MVSGVGRSVMAGGPEVGKPADGRKARRRGVAPLQSLR